MSNDRLIPADFPRQAPLGAVPGLQPKLLARKVDGRYVVGLTDEEIFARYETCEDLVQQLTAYCGRKQQKRPDWTPEGILQKVTSAIRKKSWDFSELELRWVMTRVEQQLGWPESPR